MEVYNHEVYKPDNTACIKYYLIINWKHTYVVKYSQNDGHNCKTIHKNNTEQ